MIAIGIAILIIGLITGGFRFIVFFILRKTLPKSIYDKIYNFWNVARHNMGKDEMFHK